MSDNETDERLAAAEAAAHEHWQRGARDADAELGRLAVKLNKAEARLARVEKLVGDDRFWESVNHNATEYTIPAIREQFQITLARDGEESE